MLDTPRLVLRPWLDRDREAWAAMKADPRVMEHFPDLWDRARADGFIDRRHDLFARDGFAFAAIERRTDGALYQRSAMVTYEGIPREALT